MKQNEAVVRIRDYLFSNNFKPGDRIPIQSELSKILGISARPLRDGTNVLINQGFLVPKGRAGTFMADPRQESVVQPIRWLFELNNIQDTELIDARSVLECAIIADVCNNRTTRDLLLLQQIVDEQKKTSYPAQEELELDKEFHLQLINCAHNQVLSIVGNVILLQLDLLYERGLYPGCDSIRAEDHQRIIEAAYQKDAKLATQLVREHINRCYSVAERNQNRNSSSGTGA